MQQVQEKPFVRSQAPAEQAVTFKQSVVPATLSVASKACYGLAGASILVSVALWDRASIRAPKLSMPKLGKQQNRKTSRNHMATQHAINAVNAIKSVRPTTKQQRRDARQRSAFVGAWAPTLVLAGRVLGDASERITQRERTQWDQQQSGKGRSQDLRSRLFNR